MIDNIEFNFETSTDDEAVLLANLLNKNIDKESALYIIKHQNDDVIRTGTLPLNEDLALAILDLKNHFSLHSSILSIYNRLLHKALKRYTFAKFTEGVFLNKIDKKSIASFIKDCINLHLDPFTDAIKSVIDDDYRFQTVLTVHGFTKLLNDSNLADGYKFKEKKYKEHSLTLYKEKLPRICECYLYRKDRKKPCIGASFLAEFEKADIYTTNDDLNVEQSMRLLAFCRAISMSFGIKVGIELGAVTFVDIFNISRAINFDGFRVRFSENIGNTPSFDCDDDNTFNNNKRNRDFNDEIKSLVTKTASLISTNNQDEDMVSSFELDDTHANIDASNNLEKASIENISDLDDELNKDKTIANDLLNSHLGTSQTFSNEVNQDSSLFDAPVENLDSLKDKDNTEDSIVSLDGANKVKDLAKIINNDEDNDFKSDRSDDLNSDLNDARETLETVSDSDNIIIATDNEKDQDNTDLLETDLTDTNENASDNVQDYMNNDIDLLTPANDIIDNNNMEKSSAIVKDCLEGMLDDVSDNNLILDTDELEENKDTTSNDDLNLEQNDFVLNIDDDVKTENTDTQSSFEEIGSQETDTSVNKENELFSQDTVEQDSTVDTNVDSTTQKTVSVENTASIEENSSVEESVAVDDTKAVEEISSVDKTPSVEDSVSDSLDTKENTENKELNTEQVSITSESSQEVQELSLEPVVDAKDNLDKIEKVVDKVEIGSSSSLNINSFSDKNKLDDASFIEAVTEVPNNYLPPLVKKNDVDLVLDKVQLQSPQQESITLIQPDNVQYDPNIPTINFDIEENTSLNKVKEEENKDVIHFEINETTPNDDSVDAFSFNSALIDNSVNSVIFDVKSKDSDLKDKTLIDKLNTDTQFKVVQDVDSVQNADIDELDEAMLEKLTAPDSEENLEKESKESKFSDRHNFYATSANDLNSNYNSTNSQYIFNNTNKDK